MTTFVKIRVSNVELGSERLVRKEVTEIKKTEITIIKTTFV